MKVFLGGKRFCFSDPPRNSVRQTSAHLFFLRSHFDPQGWGQKLTLEAFDDMQQNHKIIQLVIVDFRHSNSEDKYL